MYMDKLDGRITQDFFDKQAGTLRQEQDGLLRKSQVIQKTTPVLAVRLLQICPLTSSLKQAVERGPISSSNACTLQGT